MMRLMPFVVWVIGWPLLGEISKHLEWIRTGSLNAGQELIGVTASIWIVVALILLLLNISKR